MDTTTRHGGDGAGTASEETQGAMASAFRSGGGTASHRRALHFLESGEN